MIRSDGFSAQNTPDRSNMKTTIAENIALTVERRLDIAATQLMHATDRIETYLDIGCPPPPIVKHEYPTEASASAMPSMLEQARQRAVLACINIEASMLALMAVPAHNTLAAIKLARSIGGLPKDRRRRIKTLIKARELLDQVNDEIIMTEESRSRVDLRSCSRIARERIALAARAVGASTLLRT